jgi:RNA polymerase-binding transcription factor DksA/predicted ATPase
MTQHAVNRYNDDDLNEFRALVEQKLQKARNELTFIVAQLHELSVNSTTQIKGLDDSILGGETELLSSVAARQEKYIQHLENALIRIHNKSYGICRITGNLIPKIRLMTMPITTTSVVSMSQSPKLLIKSLPSPPSKPFEKGLPYTIKQVKIQNFQDIEAVSIQDLNPKAQWILLTGENSYGKTTLLQAIAFALTGELVKHHQKENFAIELQTQNKSVILNYWNRRDFQPFIHFACYGASRLMLQTDRSKNEVSEKSSVTYSLFNSDGVLLNIEFELFIWFLEKDIRFQEIVTIFTKLIPSIEEIIVEKKDRTVYYIEKKGGKRLTFNQLGSGYRSLIGMVGDMMIRLFKTQPEITKPSDLAGIVLIDELDLHWHPKWQRRLPTLLSEIFPKVQFIASTHSEIPLLGAPENSIFLKVTRTLEEGVKVHKIDIDLSNLLPNHLLTSALFDMDFNDITSVTHKPKQNLRTEDTMREIKKIDDVEAYLKDYAANNAKFSDDLFD